MFVYLSTADDLPLAEFVAEPPRPTSDARTTTIDSQAHGQPFAPTIPNVTYSRQVLLEELLVSSALWLPPMSNAFLTVSTTGSLMEVTDLSEISRLFAPVSPLAALLVKLKLIVIITVTPRLVSPLSITRDDTLGSLRTTRPILLEDTQSETVGTRDTMLRKPTVTHSLTKLHVKPPDAFSRVPLATRMISTLLTTESMEPLPPPTRTTTSTVPRSNVRFVREDLEPV